GEKYHFSISHCGDYAAVIVSKEMRVGIDIELIRQKIELIKHKFLNDTEILLLKANDLQQLTLLWNCKEAVFKWYGKGGLDFKKNIVIEKIQIHNDRGIVDCLFTMDRKRRIEIDFCFFQNLCLAWIAE
ncbi:MAG: 4'-phosphopantetheinyl transferase superfamily protein, partial [Bacteroidota bacterium]|nr:4'-phosphopantetheinyl transferase superfamily protein [Bacteroidota bacterium]